MYVLAFHDATQSEKNMSTLALTDPHLRTPGAYLFIAWAIFVNLKEKTNLKSCINCSASFFPLQFHNFGEYYVKSTQFLDVYRQINTNIFFLLCYCIVYPREITKQHLVLDISQFCKLIMPCKKLLKKIKLSR